MEEQTTMGKTEEKKVVLFGLAGEIYGLDIQNVTSIEPLGHMTPVPKAASFDKGVMNLRGRVLAVIDLREKLNMPSIPVHGQQRILVVEFKEKEAGLLVDEAKDVIDITAADMAKSTGPSESDTRFVRRRVYIEGQMITLLHVDHLLTRSTDRI